MIQLVDSAHENDVCESRGQPRVDSHVVTCEPIVCEHFKQFVAARRMAAHGHVVRVWEHPGGYVAEARTALLHYSLQSGCEVRGYLKIVRKDNTSRKTVYT